VLPLRALARSYAVEDLATTFKWELYDLSKDWTPDDDVAAANPQKP
jgi:hypothetical protein